MTLFDNGVQFVDIKIFRKEDGWYAQGLGNESWYIKGPFPNRLAAAVAVEGVDYEEMIKDLEYVLNVHKDNDDLSKTLEYLIAAYFDELNITAWLSDEVDILKRKVELWKSLTKTYQNSAEYWLRNYHDSKKEEVDSGSWTGRQPT